MGPPHARAPCPCSHPYHLQSFSSLPQGLPRGGGSRKGHLALQGWGRQGCWRSPGPKQAALPAAGSQDGTASARGPGAAPCWKIRLGDAGGHPPSPGKPGGMGKLITSFLNTPRRGQAGNGSSVRADPTPAFAKELGRLKGFCKPQAVIIQTAQSPPPEGALGPAPRSHPKPPVPLRSLFLPLASPRNRQLLCPVGGSQPAPCQRSH